MTAPPKNICAPANIFGGFDQTLFLGCSVMSFSASSGWNEQQAEVTVQLVEDSCAPPAGQPKKYHDLSLVKQDWTLADPGFYGLTTNIIGAPVYFRVGDFEFAGQVQSWEEFHSTSGNPTYSVKIVDPRALIENSQVIINEYAGGVGALYNIVNVYGYMETFGGACPQYYQSAPGVYSPGDGGIDGATFGAPAQAYGGANANDNGMQWNQILAGTRLLLSSFPATTNIWSPYGRLAFKAPSSYPAAGMGIMPADIFNLAYYYLDLEEVPIAPAYWRIQGTSTSILDSISQICQDSGHDYFIDLIPIVGGALGPGIHKFIKVRTVNRFASPALNSIDAFVASADRQVMSNTKGRELRNEVTQSFVIGGPKNNLYQAEQSDDPEGDGQPTPPEQDDMIIPYFGLDPATGDSIIPEKDANDWWFFNASTDDIAVQLANNKYKRVIVSRIEINEQELMAATSGYDAWAGYASTQDTELWQALGVNIAAVFNVFHVINMVKNINIDLDKMRPADLLAIRNGAFQPHEDPNFDFEVLQIGFAWIQKFANEYYGKKFQVRVPFTCGRTDPESGKILFSESPNDGGWTEVTPIIGLAHPSPATDFFTLADNRLGAFSRWDDLNGLELAGLSPNDFVSTNDLIWIKVGVEADYVYVDKSTLFSPRAVITLPQAIKQVAQPIDQNQSWDALVTIFSGLKNLPVDEVVADAVVREALKGVGAVQIQLPLASRAEMPDAATFGIKSNVLTYGPWGAAGAVGGVEVRQDGGLVPWEYGGFTDMHLAGNSVANEGITNQQVAEAGEVTVVGYPNLPLGAELLAADAGNPFFGSVGDNLVENRTASSGLQNGITYYLAPSYLWNGTYGPNITNITTGVGPDGLQTTYSMKTWSPKWGRFLKGNAERLKKIGRQRLDFNKQVRAFALNRIGRSNQILLDNLAGNRLGVDIGGGRLGGNTPHEILAAQLITWGGGTYRRPIVATMPIAEAIVEIHEDYEEKAFMSHDGFFRPFSLSGSGGLPMYAEPKSPSVATSACQKASSQGAQPPVDSLAATVGALTYYNLDIDVEYLNPFSNPTGFNWSLLTDQRCDTNVGHDIEIVGRGTTPPASSMFATIQGYADTGDTQVSDYANDYRPLCLKGPVVISMWGYDLDGKPIPNKIDDEPSITGAGTFADTALEDKFLNDWLRKPQTWPVAPLDLRFDRARSVWTIPQYRHIVVKAEEDIQSLGSGKASQISGPTLYKEDGSTLSDPAVLAHDRVGNCNSIKSGELLIVEFDPYACEYSIIERRSNSVSLIDIECTGGTGVLAPSVGDINIGTGLRILATTDQNGCSTATLFNNHAVIDTNCCLTPADGFTRNVTSASTFYETLNFGAGLWLYKANPSDNPGVPGEDCGLTFGDTTDQGCLVNVMAGFQPLNTYQNCFTETLLTDDASRFINVLDFQGGMRAVDGPNECDLLVRAGIEWQSTTTGCVPTTNEPLAGTIHHKIKTFKGLRINDVDPDDCQIEMDAGIDVSTSLSCIVPGVDNSFVNEIAFGKGLSVAKDGKCGVNVGLYFDIDGVPVANLVLGNCLEITDNGGCEGSLGFAQGFGDGDTDHAFNFINDISYECCPTGGVKKISYATRTMNFNACGQLISVDDPVWLSGGDCSCIDPVWLAGLT